MQIFLNSAGGLALFLLAMLMMTEGLKALAGGMSVSVVTMFIVPCLFCAIEEWKWKRAKRVATTVTT